MMISNRVDQLFFSGTSGAQIMEEFSVFTLRNNTTSLVIIDVESNDLANGFSVKDIVRTLIDVAIIMVEQYKVQHVKICSCLMRENRIGNLIAYQF